MLDCRSQNAKKEIRMSFNIRISMASPGNYDTRDDAPCRVQERVQIVGTGVSIRVTLLMGDRRRLVTFRYCS